MRTAFEEANTLWGLKLTAQVKCQDCGNLYEIEVPIDPVRFFFSIIHSKDPQLIANWLNRSKHESESIVRSAMDLSYYMRGAMQYKDVMHMSHTERQIGFDYVNKKLEQSAKMPYPVF